jgi:hypothetical protein
MSEAAIFFLILIIYIVISYYLTRFIARKLISINPIIRIVILSFFYALFFGIGIVAGGGDPGFGFPVPNLAVIFIDAFFENFSIGTLRVDLVITLFWWIIIFLVMIIGYFVINGGNKNTRHY